MIASIVTVGDELLNGQTVDTNAAWLGVQLNGIGVTLSLKLSVSDTIGDIIKGLHFASQNSDIILITGGLGPTKDDITKEAIAEYIGDRMSFSQETYDRIKGFFIARNRPVLEAHKQQCYMPSTATLLHNPLGTAPGMWMTHMDHIILAMPGVPQEMKGIMSDDGLDRIKSLVSDSFIEHYIIQTAGVGETTIAEKIEDIVGEFPPELSIAYLPNIASVKLRLTAKALSQNRVQELTQSYGQRITHRLGSMVYGLGPQKLPKAIGKLCIEKKLIIATAESCTGGGISHEITSVAGSSAYYTGSIVSYSNELKKKLLHVSSHTLETYGAVSKETVTEMIHGLIDATQCDVGVAVSGIAGPGGGTPNKPVGTIWLAIGNQEKTVTRKLQLVRNRKLNIDYTISLAMNELRLFIESNF